MKSSVAFAIGLWTGGLVIGAVWALHHQGEDDPRRYDVGGAEDTPGVVLTGGLGGPPMPVPTEPIDPDPDRPPRD